MNILFSTHSDMMEIEKKLALGKIKPCPSPGSQPTYYETHTPSAIVSILGSKPNLVVVVNTVNKTYMVTYTTDSTKTTYDYLTEKNVINRLLLVPTYKSRIIKK